MFSRRSSLPASSLADMFPDFRTCRILIEVSLERVRMIFLESLERGRTVFFLQKLVFASLTLFSFIPCRSFPASSGSIPVIHQSFQEGIVNYRATSDKPTPVNLTNHTYFNLNGGKKDILDHVIEIKSNSVLETNQQNIPTGKIIPVKNTGYDLQKPILLRDSEIMNNEGFDHCFVLDKTDTKPEFAAKVSEPSNPVSVEIFTTEPTLQFYTSNGFDGSFVGKNNIEYRKFHGLCLEAQNFPDSPNHSNFPNSILHPGKEHKQITFYKINID